MTAYTHEKGDELYDPSGGESAIRAGPNALVSTVTVISGTSVEPVGEPAWTNGFEWKQVKILEDRNQGQSG